MLYIVTALKPEAQAFVERYRLKKAKCGRFVLFENSDMAVIVSGMGISNAAEATKTLIELFKPSKSDTLVNVGICAAHERHPIGKLLKIGTIVYENAKYTVDFSSPHTITCKDHEVSQNLYEIADMESFGFYKAAHGFCNYALYKVVSDHFNPQSVTKEGSKKLLFGVVDEIVKEVGA